MAAHEWRGKQQQGIEGREAVKPDSMGPMDDRVQNRQHRMEGREVDYPYDVIGSLASLPEIADGLAPCCDQVVEFGGAK